MDQASKNWRGWKVQLHFCHFNSAEIRASSPWRVLARTRIRRTRANRDSPYTKRTRPARRRERKAQRRRREKLPRHSPLFWVSQIFQNLSNYYYLSISLKIIWKSTKDEHHTNFYFWHYTVPRIINKLIRTQLKGKLTIIANFILFRYRKTDLVRYSNWILKLIEKFVKYWLYLNE